MASTFTKLAYHIVFSTKYRRNHLTVDVRDELYKYVAGILRAQDGALLEIGGIADHVHLLAGISPSVAVADMLRLIKANSSKWLNERPGASGGFQWQTGYAAFSVSYSQLDTVKRYIQNQEQHHERLSFKEEFIAMLQRHGIEFDPRYLFEEEHHG